ncbi:CDP-alcohol phosphatidyltransferase family protein [Arenibacter sp. F26102]|uniref:CDP-alcohol phosphatidyltransferase family protein n=1 Tax=Arenibacter sp. F26102 TaxID=2926416 RepID=UPI001FF2410C|nr:CDP-alcohol phosphatidyltransferase family protein [Arenibacter sp. F26102]MCK0147366.1 CDP-alcohol phosphatidyltransferase family protein [Arenibacter sp. F26102]
MSKLPEDHKFLDLSDYGRPIARLIANALKSTAVTPIHVTFGFLVSGVIAVGCMYHAYYWCAALFFILKSILDAADGELARIKETPSYTGRYFDSVSDIVLNILIFLVLWRITSTDFGLTLLAFLGFQLQGTLYNYYYVILRNKFQGDVTSRIFESGTPVAMVGEHQRNVNILFWWYKILYGSFDLIIYKLDAEAANGRRLPNWLMTAVSTFGLGFQLLIISVMLVLGWVDYIIPFFIIYSIFIFLFIAIRRSL